MRCTECISAWRSSYQSAVVVAPCMHGSTAMLARRGAQVGVLNSCALLMLLADCFSKVRSGF